MRGSGIYLVLFFLIYQSVDLPAQISEGGFPPSFRGNLKSWQEIPLYILPEVNEEELKQEDIELCLAEQCNFRVAKGFQVDIGIQKEGLWENLADGSKLWRMGVKSMEADAIHVFFDQYILPEGARLFIYNREKTTILGAFTSRNNAVTGKLAIAPVPGDEIMIEYYEPAGVPYPGILHISNIGHNYRTNSLYDASGFGDSELCNKDVVCTEGKDWQKEKRSVCLILFQDFSGSYFICTGALINTARYDGKPYLLTANHCLPTSIEAESAVYYFNYESPTCIPRADGNKSQTISGSTIRGTYNRLDFCLVELSTAPPQEYNPYYSGWDITPDPPQSCVTIHHPVGDVKKISFYNKSPKTGNFIYRFDFDDNTHWYIDRWTKGITQGGSSGSPLYNQDHRIVGDLTGGTAEGQNCTSVDAYYAKFSESWDNYSDTSYQLKYWLDPDNTGVAFTDGFDPVSSSVFDLNHNINVKLYPNPTDGILYLESECADFIPESVQIYDLSGRLLSSLRIYHEAGKREIDLTHLSEGVYFLIVRGSNKILTQKVFIY